MFDPENVTFFNASETTPVLTRTTLPGLVLLLM